MFEIGLELARRYLSLPQSDTQDERAEKTLGALERLGPTNITDRQRVLALKAQHLADHSNTDEAVDLLRRLLEQHPDDSDVIISIVRVADALEAEWRGRATAGPAESDGVSEELIATYRYLLTWGHREGPGHGLLEDVVVRRRLADALFRTGEPDQAVLHYDWLLANLPAAKTAAIRRQHALCLEQLDQMDMAVQQWTILTRGLAPQTEPWYEAQYHQLTCLSAAEQRPKAAAMLEYFLLRHPEVASSPWGAKFNSLQDELGSDPSEKRQPVTGQREGGQ